MAMELRLREGKPLLERRASLVKGRGVLDVDEGSVEWAPGRRALALRVAVASQVEPRGTAERRPAPQLVRQSSGELPEPPPAADPAGLEPLAAEPEALCRRTRKICFRLETTYDISDIQVARAVP
jgi:hypothetical protein